MEQIGTRMKELREASHLSQAKIALLCGIGQATIAKAEKGRILPSLKLLIWWADYFDVSLDYLICGNSRETGIERIVAGLSETEMQFIRSMILNAVENMVLLRK